MAKFTEDIDRKMIGLIKDQESLWNHYKEDYKNNAKNNLLWQQIAVDIGIEGIIRIQVDCRAKMGPTLITRYSNSQAANLKYL